MKFLLALALISSVSTQSLAYYVGGQFKCQNNLVGTAKIEISNDLKVVVFQASRHRAVELSCAPVYRTKPYQQSTFENIGCKLPGTDRQSTADLIISRAVDKADYEYFSALVSPELAQLSKGVLERVMFQCDQK